jgi:hypothetical protein
MPREKVGCCCPFTDPDLAARKLVEIANGVGAAMDGRIYSVLTRPSSRLAAAARTFAPGSSAPSPSAGCGRHESGTYVKFTDVSAALFA